MSTGTKFIHMKDFTLVCPIQVCLPLFEIDSVAAFIPVLTIDRIGVVADLSMTQGPPMVKREL